MVLRGERGNGGTGERSLLKKLRKTFIRGWIWVEFVQIRLLPNVSDPFPEKIVRERLTGSSAFYGERVLDIVYSM